MRRYEGKQENTEGTVEKDLLTAGRLPSMVNTRSRTPLNSYDIWIQSRRRYGGQESCVEM